MRFIFASDSFKGSISGKRTAELLSQAAREVFPDCGTLNLAMADGGEGTVDAVLDASGGEKVYAEVHDPLMEPIRAYYGKIDHDTAIIEMAATSGLTLIPAEKRDPLITSSYGTGELVEHAIRAGFKNIVIAIGGSATNDGGMGFAKALGIRFTDEAGDELDGRGIDLERVAHIDLSGLMPEIAGVSFTVMCDVDNPLCGSNGVTYTYGKQKGASEDDLKRLEAGMIRYRDVIRNEFGIDPDSIPGAGAAGGLGAALSIFFKAKMRSGIDTLLDLSGFDRMIGEDDIIITGEGCLDYQSLNGKVVMGIADRARKHGIPVIALCGCTGDRFEKIYDHGISEVWTTKPDGMELSEAIERAEELYLKTAREMLEAVRERRK
ncbi:MAG: glycerate kinase [Lachnospiraceae bacterium]|nr:glycerate kinase [Lachnospiraceae bacterium]